MIVPIVLTGSSLGKRQQQLNFKVINTAKENVPFEEIKDAPEKSDLDKLFKIDLASRYKKVNNIIEILKSGDSLYVTRALKCVWLYEDSHSQLVNPDYLHHNVFQDVSTKIKVKILTSISTHVRNEKRAEEFYNYCMNSKLPHQAYKFLIFTSSQLKVDMIKNNFNTLQSLLENRSDITYFIGNDVTLAESYLESTFKSERSDVLHYFRYLYSVDASKYLDWLEKYWDSNIHRSRRLGRRISIDVLKNHKRRIFNNIPLYCTLLNQDVLNKKSTVVEIKQYAIGLLPQDAEEFWSLNFYIHYQTILDKIPKEERYHFIKKIFNEKYRNIEFEMSKYFYGLRYFDYLMSAQEQESWAWRHLSAKTSIFEYLEDYTYSWYEFVNFDAAFEILKKCVQNTRDDSRRSKLVGVLAKSAKSLNDVNKLLNYYNQRHLNETQEYKEWFLECLWNHHYVFEFDASTFAIYDKLLHSYHAYEARVHSFRKKVFLNDVLIYHVINNLEFPKCLKDYSETATFQGYDLERLLRRLNDEQKEKVYEYILQLYMERIKQLRNKDNGSNISKKVSYIIRCIKDLHERFEKTDGLPNIDLEYIKSKNTRKYFSKSECDPKKTQRNMLQVLKNDASLAVDKLDLLKHTIEDSHHFVLNTYLNKIHIYFPDSIALQYLNFFTDCLTAESNNERRLMFMSVYAIFQLADETKKIQFLSKYLPVDPKNDHGVIDKRYLYIQEAIYRFACFSRPPVPFSKVLQYVTGDNLKYCLPMFNFYLANLPPTPRLLFVESLINSPVSVHKHGLRLAFKCYDTNDLKKLLTYIWSKTKNVALRMLLYVKLFEYLQHKDEQTQSEMFKIVLDMIADLNDDDHDDLFSLLIDCDRINSLPQAYRGTYCETVYKTLQKFPDNYPKNLDRLKSALKSITELIVVMNIDFVRAIVKDYLNNIFEGKRMALEDDFKDINKKKCELTVALIALYASNGNVDSAKELTDCVMTGCLNKWNETYEFNVHTYIYTVYTDLGLKQYFSRHYLFDFIDMFLDNDFEFCSNHSSLNPILDHIRQYLDNALPNVSYMLGWKLRLLIICKMMIDEYKQIQEVNINTAEAMMKTYAFKVKEIVDEYISEGVFHLNHVADIAKAIKSNIEKMVSAVKMYPNFYYESHLFVSREFVSYKLPLTILLAIDILPDHHNISVKSLDCYKKVWYDIENVDNLAVRAQFYHRFAVNWFCTLR